MLSKDVWLGEIQAGMVAFDSARFERRIESTRPRIISAVVDALKKRKINTRNADLNFWCLRRFDKHTLDLELAIVMRMYFLSEGEQRTRRYEATKEAETQRLNLREKISLHSLIRML